jgi:hypothetical protein
VRSFFFETNNTLINMGLFIKTIGRGGDKGLLNVQNVEHIGLSKDNGVCYTPIRGFDQHASYYPTVAYCTDEIAKIVFEEIIDFMAVNTDGVYDAYTRVQELNKARLDKLHA